MEILLIIAGVALLAGVVWWAENREVAQEPRDWPTSQFDAKETSIGTFTEATDEAQDAAKAEWEFLCYVSRHTPDKFSVDGVLVELERRGFAGYGFSSNTIDVTACGDVICTVNNAYSAASGDDYTHAIMLPEIWTVLRPRLQQIADERKAAAEAEKAAKHADILRKLEGAV